MTQDKQKLDDNEEDAKDRTLESALRAVADRTSSIEYQGFQVKDNNIEGNFLLVESDGTYYSFSTGDIVDAQRMSEEHVHVWIRRGSRAWRSSAVIVGEEAAGSMDFAEIEEFAVGMEDIEPPPMEEVPGMPIAADEGDYQQLALELLAPRTIRSAAAAYNGRCTGGDRYRNNCAHFLSDAFIRAGFQELAYPNNPYRCISRGGRCGTSARRVIRARDMWCWFQKKATHTSRSLQRNTGMWAVFQLDGYWGGHVVIIDTDAWKYYGTASHWNWNQYLYKW